VVWGPRALISEMPTHRISAHMVLCPDLVQHGRKIRGRMLCAGLRLLPEPIRLVWYGAEILDLEAQRG